MPFWIKCLVAAIALGAPLAATPVVASPEPAAIRPAPLASPRLATGKRRFYQGHLQEALALFQQSRQAYRAADDAMGEAEALVFMAKTYDHLLRPDLGLPLVEEALNLYQQASATGSAAERRLGATRARHQRAILQYNLGQREAALASLERSQAQFHALGATIDQGIVLADLGAFALEDRDPEALLPLLLAGLDLVQGVSGDDLAAAQRADYYEALALLRIGRAYLLMAQPEQAREAIAASLAMSRRIDARLLEYATLGLQGRLYESQSDLDMASRIQQRAQNLAANLDHLGYQATLVKQLGDIYRSHENYPSALIAYRRAAELYSTVDQMPELVEVLLQISDTSHKMGYYEDTIATAQKAIAAIDRLESQYGQGTWILNSRLLAFSYTGLALQAQGKLSQAMEWHQQSAALARELERPDEAAARLRVIGQLQGQMGDHQRGVETLHEALELWRELGDVGEQVSSLIVIGQAQRIKGDYPSAIAALEKALALAQPQDPAQQALLLSELGLVYSLQGQLQTALRLYRRALTLTKSTADRAQQAGMLDKIALSYLKFGRFSEAIQSFQQALQISQELKFTFGEANTLNNLGVAYSKLGQRDLALKHHQQALRLFRDLQSTAAAARARASEATTLNNLAAIHTDGAQYDAALASYRQALAVAEKLDNPRLWATILNNIAIVHEQQNRPALALSHYKQSLNAAREIGSLTQEGTALNNIGELLLDGGQPAIALDYLQQALVLHQETGDRLSEADTLSNLGYLLEQQGQPEIAIIFLKQAVNQWETVRGNLGDRPTQQQTFTDTVADIYHHLADLLLQSDRILEAQRVLDLLKVQELSDYLQVRSIPEAQQGIDILPLEAELIEDYGRELARQVALGRQLQAIPRDPEQRTPEQEQRRREIEAEQKTIRRELIDFIETPQVQAAAARRRQSAQGEALELKLLNGLQDKLAELGEDVVLLYPLVLEDRLELILVTQYAPPLRHSVPVSRTELNTAILAYRQALRDPYSDPIPLAQQLYDWLIRPLEPVLQTSEAQTLLYAPDGQLRYIPLAALHDGQQWLAERYRVNHITTASLPNLNDSSQSLDILAGAFGTQGQSVELASNRLTFVGLPFTIDEVQTLADSIADTTPLLNAEFSLAETEAQMSDYSILHLATHAAFVIGAPNESFILFGNGDRATFRDVEVWPLINTDLVVLSACETGVGGIRDGDGKEILGFGYLMQQAGAKAAIASLWQVSDGGTQVLMNAFYAALSQGYSKAESLRLAQQALINGPSAAAGNRRANVEVINTLTGEPFSPGRLSHPYYWAPFILIGNGL